MFDGACQPLSPPLTPLRLHPLRRHRLTEPQELQQPHHTILPPPARFHSSLRRWSPVPPPLAFRFTRPSTADFSSLHRWLFASLVPPTLASRDSSLRCSPLDPLFGRCRWTPVPPCTAPAGPDAATASLAARRLRPVGPDGGTGPPTTGIDPWTAGVSNPRSTQRPSNRGASATCRGGREWPTEAWLH